MLCKCYSKLSFIGVIINFELFFKRFRNLDILSDKDLNFVKSETKEEAPSSYRTYNNMSQNLSINELIALQNLSQSKDLIIQKSDKGNSVAIANTQGCIKKVHNICKTKFTIVNLKDDTI